MNISPVAPVSFKSTAAVADDAVKKVPKIVKMVKNTKAYNLAEKALDKYVIENIAKGMGKVANLKPVGGFIDQINNWKSPYQRLCDIGSVVLTVFTVKDTLKSKKISDERKPFMVVNNILVTAVSSLLAGLIDRFSYEPQRQITNAFIQDYAKKVTPEFVKDYIADPKNASFVKEKGLKNLGVEEATKEIIMKNYDKFAAGLSKFKSTFIFTAIVRFLVPVAFIPITAKIIDKLEDRAKEKKGQKESQNAQAQPANPVQPQAQTQNTMQPQAPNAVQPQMQNNAQLQGGSLINKIIPPVK